MDSRVYSTRVQHTYSWRNIIIMSPGWFPSIYENGCVLHKTSLYEDYRLYWCFLYIVYYCLPFKLLYFGFGRRPWLYVYRKRRNITRTYPETSFRPGVLQNLGRGGTVKTVDLLIYFVKETAEIDASLGVFSTTPSPLSKNPILKLPEGVCYLGCSTVSGRSVVT